jgi:hypothetical protein
MSDVRHERRRLGLGTLKARWFHVLPVRLIEFEKQPAVVGMDEETTDAVAE